MPPFSFIHLIVSIKPSPHGFPTLDVGPVKSTKCPIGISFAIIFFY